MGARIANLSFGQETCQDKKISPRKVMFLQKFLLLYLRMTREATQSPSQSDNLYMNCVKPPQGHQGRLKLPEFTALHRFMTSDIDTSKPAADVRHSLPMALLRARESVMRNYRPMLDSFDVNEQQWRVLRVLNDAEELDASEVAARANILAPSLTRMIRAMCDRGLITRGRDENDARRVMLKIAPAGLEVIRNATSQSGEIHASILERFGDDRMSTLVALLNDLSTLSQTQEA